MKKMFSVAALALVAGLALPTSASANGKPAYDVNNDGMVTKQEFLDAMGKQYDEAMAKAKQMPTSDQAKMIKGVGMTNAGVDWFLRDIMRGLGQ